MKKYTFLLIMLLMLLSILFIKSKEKSSYNDDYLTFLINNNLNKEEIEFILNNNIEREQIIPYLDYSTFNPLLFFEYEEIKKTKSYSTIETLNYINFPNYYNFYIFPKEAPFKNTPLLLVNKCFFLDSSYQGNNLIEISTTNLNYIKRKNEIMKVNKEALEHYQILEKDARSLGYELYIFSAYRSYEKQHHLYYEVNNQNDSTVARPGFSEHQSGFSLDISTLKYGLTNNFKDSKEFNWLINNAYKYGFILRYPLGKENITGYSYESWHFRYVGVNVAKIIFEENLTLEEYIFKYCEIK